MALSLHAAGRGSAALAATLVLLAGDADGDDLDRYEPACGATPTISRRSIGRASPFATDLCPVPRSLRPRRLRRRRRSSRSRRESDEATRSPAWSRRFRGGTLEFGVLREGLDVSDATLSKHLRTLTDAGYVDLRRVQRAKGQARTWVALTPAGSQALRGHFAFLQGLAPL